MEKTQFQELLKEINKEIEHNKEELNKVVQEEFSKGTNVSIEEIVKLINSYNEAKVVAPEGKSIAVTYSGNPEIAVTYMLDSILYNNKVVLFANGNKKLNELLYSIFSQSLIGCKIKNQWIDYNSNYNEILLKDHEESFNEIIYIGDYFEYMRFKNFFKKEVKYSNYGNIKLFINKDQYGDEYNKIIKFCDLKNISLEIYDDADDFINESREEDFAVVFADFKDVNKFQKLLRSGEILINTFPYDSYKFKIER